jgi:hypothetical protein
MPSGYCQFLNKQVKGPINDKMEDLVTKRTNIMFVRGSELMKHYIINS